jgi:carbon storage regulator
MIGDDIEVRIVAIHGDRARLGISGPKDIAVHRREVYDKIHQQIDGPETPQDGRPN